ncbi:gamma carbonic anhydrase family protein [Rhodococcus sp. P1Y]|nr:gamma carbonic anhydrase family protein [Rhodococcus sp. P1Y]
MLYEHRGASPSVSENAWVAPTAVLIGDVIVGAGSRVLHGAVLTAEDGQVSIGKDVVVMENAVIKGRAGHSVTIGDSVLIGPHAHVNGTSVGRESFIATGASTFPGSVVEAGCELRINAVLQVNSRLAAGSVVPISWVAVGDPAQLFSPDRHDDIWAIQKTLNFTGTVYGTATGVGMDGIMEKQSRFYGTHVADVEIPDGPTAS